MDVQTALHGRRTIHRYTTDDVPKAAVQRALEAASQAPNHRCTWPWRFTVLARAPRERIAEIAVDLKTRGEPLAMETVRKIRAKILNPAWLVVVRRVRHEDETVAREDYAAVACAMQNMQLSLYADGIGSKWSSGKVTTDARTYEHLRIDAASEAIEGFLWVGMPADEHRAPERPDSESLTTWMR